MMIRSSLRRSTAALLLILAFAACKKQRTAAEEVRLANKVSTRTVTLFFETPDLLLGPESRTLPLPEDEAQAMGDVMKELLKGSANTAVPKLFPVDVTLRGAYLLPDGTAVIDLGGSSLSNGWPTGSHQELMAVYGVVSTMTTNFRSVQKVRLLVNGQVTQTLAGHVSIDRSLRPSRQFVVAAVAAQLKGAK